MKRWMVYLWLCMAALMASAAHADDALLRQLEERLGRQSCTTGTFVQTARVAILNEPVVSRGRFYADAGTGISWHVDAPIAVQFQFVSAAASAQPGASRGAIAWVARILNAVFTGELGTLQQMFNISGTTQASRWTLALSPKTSALRRFVSTISVEGADAINAIRIEQADGDSIEIVFSDIAHPDELPEAILDEFKPHA